MRSLSTLAVLIVSAVTLEGSIVSGHGDMVARFAWVHQGRIPTLSFSPDCQLLASASHDGTVKLSQASGKGIGRTHT